MSEQIIQSAPDAQVPEDVIGNVLKWTLLAVAIACFAALAWATKLTYEGTPPLPDRFTSPSGTAV